MSAFADVQACDSSGLGALVAIWKNLRANGGPVVITRPPQKCRRMLTRTGLDPTITVRESLDGAVATAIRAR